MQKNSYAGCFGLYPAILSQFILKMCAADKNCKKFTKISIWVAQGRLMSKPIATVCYDKQHVCAMCAYLQLFNALNLGSWELLSAQRFSSLSHKLSIRRNKRK